MKISKFTLVIIMVVIITSCNFHPNQSQNKFNNRNEAKIFAPGSITTPMAERDAAFSPDGMEYCPYVSADGKILYFSRKEIPLPTEEK